MTHNAVMSSVGSEFGRALAGAFDPLRWGSGAYFALIVGLLLVRVLAPWPRSGPLLFLRELCLILPAGLFYFFVRGLVAADTAGAVAHARRIVWLERRLGIFVEPRLQRAVLDHPVLVDLANWIYVWAHWPVILAWVVWMWTRHRDAYPTYRNAVLLSGAAAMLVFAFYPVAPPRYLPALGFVDTITLRSHSYRALQPPALEDLYASMPSLHFGWDLLVGIAIARHARTVPGRLLGVVLPPAMFGAIVLTANHFLLDGLAGAAFALTGLAASTALARWHGWRTSTSAIPRDAPPTDRGLPHRRRRLVPILRQAPPRQTDSYAPAIGFGRQLSRWRVPPLRRRSMVLITDSPTVRRSSGAEAPSTALWGFRRAAPAAEPARPGRLRARGLFRTAGRS